MAKSSKDKEYWDSIKDSYSGYVTYFKSKVKKKRGSEYPDHPLCNYVKDEIDKIITSDTENELFEKLERVKTLWKDLIRRSIICLRYYDTREPFLEKPAKRPLAYGIDSLYRYFDKYVDFESVLYGGSSSYRDHVIHVFRVWLIGIDTLIKDNCNFMKRVTIDNNCKVNPLEIESIWTIIALTHDLGYPLERSSVVIERTREMMKSFVSNPMINMDVSFSGVQDNMNDFVLRFMSSKMKKNKTNDSVVRMQPKYYFKFQKSLEYNKHGVLSALIIYKLLVFFLESDFSLHEDYHFKDEDVRQFYIRREVLRAIASHTCFDIYQLSMFNLSFLLILCDEAQEWGRKSINELYVERGVKYTLKGIEINYDSNPCECTLRDSYEVPSDSEIIKSLIKRFLNQSRSYVLQFRDGQDTAKRNFDFHRIVEIEVTTATRKRFQMDLMVTSSASTKIVITQTVGSFAAKDKFNNAIDELFDKKLEKDETAKKIIIDMTTEMMDKI